MSTENLEHEDQNRTTEPIIDILGNEAPLIQNRKLFPKVSTTTAPLKRMCVRPIRLFCSSSNGSGIRSLR